MVKGRDLIVRHDLSALLRSMQKAASGQKPRPADPSAGLSINDLLSL